MEEKKRSLKGIKGFTRRKAKAFSKRKATENRNYFRERRESWPNRNEWLPSYSRAERRRCALHNKAENSAQRAKHITLRDLYGEAERRDQRCQRTCFHRPRWCFISLHFGLLKRLSDIITRRIPRERASHKGSWALPTGGLDKDSNSAVREQTAWLRYNWLPWQFSVRKGRLGRCQVQEAIAVVDLRSRSNLSRGVWWYIERVERSWSWWPRPVHVAILFKAHIHRASIRHASGEWIPLGWQLRLGNIRIFWRSQARRWLRRESMESLQWIRIHPRLKWLKLIVKSWLLTSTFPIQVFVSPPHRHFERKQQISTVCKVCGGSNQRDREREEKEKVLCDR